MIVGSAGNYSITMFVQARCERFRIYHHLSLIIAELRLERFLKTNRLRRNDVHEGAALDTGKQHRIDFFGEAFFAKNDSAAWSTQTFVRRCRNELGIRNWAGMLSAGDETCDVRHVDKQNRFDRVGNLAKSWKIERPRISRGASG